MYVIYFLSSGYIFRENIRTLVYGFKFRVILSNQIINYNVCKLHDFCFFSKQ